MSFSHSALTLSLSPLDSNSKVCLCLASVLAFPRFKSHPLYPSHTTAAATAAATATTEFPAAPDSVYEATLLAEAEAREVHA